MTEGITESRFYMWRAVIALVHADHVVTPEEKELAESYLANVSFSEEQGKTLQEDLLEAQNIEEMFNQITEPSDQGEFFGFARMMVWCDGDYDRQEEEIFERLKNIQMNRINPEELKSTIQESRRFFDMERLKENAEFHEEAKDLVSLSRLFDALKKNPALHE